MGAGPVRERGPFPVPALAARRWLMAVLVAGTTAAGFVLMADIVGAGGVTLLEVAILALFTATFGWIVIPFWTALVGFTLRLLGRDPLSLGRVEDVDPGTGPIRARTALVMPAYNEDPSRLEEGLGTMIRSLRGSGQGSAFDVYLLSDTDNPATALEERAIEGRLRLMAGSEPGFHYRRRRANTGRKAGNIADFCRRWGSRYDFMIVLDADSVMTASAMIRLVRAMEANPGVGLIQTVPVPARQETLFGRLIQFAQCLYSPMLATGQSFWQGDSANYWGHNAILRVDASTRHGTLPVLPGRPPLGGQILSHDFVEAALLRRAGWKVLLLPWIDGSLEEVPGNVVDYAARDRRWAQGSLQHLRLLLMGGLHPVSRIHFLMGAMGFVSSALWLLLLVAGAAYVMMPSLSAASVDSLGWIASPGGVLFGTRPISLLAVTGALLFSPKLLGLVLALLQRRRGFGPPAGLLLGGMVELLFAVVIAPVMMMLHTRFVSSVLTGRAVGWGAQRRGGRTVGWTEALRCAGWITASGLAWSALTVAVSWTYFLWLTPIFVGLVLATPLVRWTGSRRLGGWTRKVGLFLVPSETGPAAPQPGVAPPLPFPTSPLPGRPAVPSLETVGKRP